MIKKAKIELLYFDNENQCREYTKLLQEKKVIPLKFGYIGKAAHTHDRLVKSKKYGLADAETALILSVFENDIFPLLPSDLVALIDLGSGNGLKAVAILELLQKLERKPLSYVGIDYSQELSKIALHNIFDQIDISSLFGLQVDIEEGPFNDVINKLPIPCGSRLFTFLGTTWGNSLERTGVLKNIRNSMSYNDGLLLGIELFNPDKIPEILLPYQNDVFYKAVFQCVTFAGLSRDDGELIVSFNMANKDVEVHFKLNQDIVIRSDINQSIFTLSKGESLLIFVSHRFTLDEIYNSAALASFKVAKLIKSTDSSSSLVYMAPQE